MARILLLNQWQVIPPLKSEAVTSVLDNVRTEVSKLAILEKEAELID